MDTLAISAELIAIIRRARPSSDVNVQALRDLVADQLESHCAEIARLREQVAAPPLRTRMWWSNG